MVCVLTHIGGHQITSECEVRPDEGPGRNATQAFGSGRSYAKRYLEKDVLNLITEGEDDDGRASGAISKDQVLTIETMLKDAGADAAFKKRLLTFAKAESISLIQAHDYGRVLQALKQEIQKKERGA